MLILMFALSDSHYLLSSQKNFSCQSLQISPWFITGLNFVFLLLFRSSSLPAQISTSHFLGLKFCNSCKNLPFLGPHDSHKHQNNIRLNHGSLPPGALTGSLSLKSEDILLTLSSRPAIALPGNTLLTFGVLKTA